MANARQDLNIQDEFLSQLCRQRTPVTLYLTTGDKLSGQLKSFDKYAIILESETHEQLVFKHAIATIIASHATPA